MKITAVETFVLSNRSVFVKVSTDEDVAGWGEPCVENWARTTVAAVERMAEYLIGRNPLQITRLWQVLSRGGYYRGGPIISSAVAGLDQALWDIKGRYLGVPVHELLGGPTRDAVRVYAGCNTDGRTGSLERAKELMQAAYTLVKIAPDVTPLFVDSPSYTDKVLADIAEFRDTIGASMDFAIDVHGRFSVAMSRRILPLLETFMPAFVEEPLRPEHSALIGQIVRSTRVPIATGERLYSRNEFKPVLEAGVAIAQPDASHAGGITECFRIATLAEVFDAQVAPHCAIGPISLAACLQIDLSVPNFYAQESALELHTGAHPGLALLTNPDVLRLVGGSVPRLTGPGLGVNIDEDAVRSAVVHGDLEPGSPLWQYDDGSFKEW